MRKFLGFICLIFVLFTTGCTTFSNLFDSFVDYEELQELTENSVLSSNVKIKRDCKVTAISPLASSTSTGSGVIFKETDDYYYFLTNNHVTGLITGFLYSYYTVYDYEGNTYEYNVCILSSSSDYDLAIGRFPKGEEELSIAPFALSNGSTNDITISIGQPNGEMNVITFGEVFGYTEISVSEESKYLSNIQFDVMSHSAYTTNGSSGGAVFNKNLELIAIAFAGDVSCSYAIPIEKVSEFIELFFVCDCGLCDCTSK